MFSKPAEVQGRAKFSLGSVFICGSSDRGSEKLRWAKPEREATMLRSSWEWLQQRCCVLVLRIRTSVSGRNKNRRNASWESDKKKKRRILSPVIEWRSISTDRHRALSRASIPWPCLWIKPRFSSTEEASLLPQIVLQLSGRPEVARTRNVSVFLPFFSPWVLIRYANVCKTRSQPTGLAPLLVPGPLYGKASIHVERKMRQIKCYDLIAQQMDNTMFNSIDSIVFVCSVLTNFQPALVM